MLEFIDTKSQDDIIFYGMRAAKEGNDTVIVDMHGLSWDFYTTGFYRHFYQHIPDLGVDFIAGETRGAYKMKLFNKTDHTYFDGGGAFEKFEDCIMDIKAWIDKAESLGYKNIFLSGYSMGPTKVAYYYSQTKDPRIKGLIFFSPSDMYGLAHEPSEIERHNRQVAEAQSFIERGEGNRILSEKLWGADFFSAATYLNLLENTNTQVFNYFKPELGYEVLRSINIPVLSFSGTKDEGITVCRPLDEAMQILEKELMNSPHKQIKVFEGADHSFEGFESELLSNCVDFVKQVSNV